MFSRFTKNRPKCKDSKQKHKIIEKALRVTAVLFYLSEIEEKIERRNELERWLDKHNHFMELVRTLIAIIVLVLQIYILINIIK